MPWVDDAAEVFERAAAGHETMYTKEPDPGKLFLDGGPPLWTIGVAFIEDPAPQFLLVTVGLSDPDQGPGIDGDCGYGFELVLRLPRTPTQQAPPEWATELLRMLARYVRSSGARLKVHDSFDLQTSIARAPFPEAARKDQPASSLVGLVFALDPEIGEVRLRKGRVRYLTVYGVHGDESRVVQGWTAAKFLELVRARDPFLVTDIRRPSWMSDRHFAEEVEAGSRQDGSALTVMPVVGLGYDIDDEGRLTVGFHGTSIEAVIGMIRRRLVFGRPFWLHTRKGDGYDAIVAIKFVPSDDEGFDSDDGPKVTVRISRGKAARLGDALSNGVPFKELPWLRVVVQYGEVKG